MASESRQLPQSNIGRMSVLDAAFMKNDALGASSFLTGLTKTRLINIDGVYRTLFDLIAVKKHDMVVLTAQKTIYAVACRMVCSHFIQVFNLAIERGVFPKEDRTLYKLDVSCKNR